MKNINCPLCHREVYIEFGKSCKLCGMILKDSGKEFCSKKCRLIYQKFRNNI